MKIMQRMLSYVRKAIDDYNMIEDGDKIAVGLSGGKDSITLLMALKALQRFYSKKFDIIAISVNPGFDFFNSDFLKKTCEEIGVTFVEEKTHIKEIVFDIRKEKNPCSLCANLRRGALNGVAEAHGCNKVALGHHQDDVIETFFLSLFYEGNIHTFSPTTYLSRKNIVTIRPMIYVTEKQIKGFQNKNPLPIMKKKCPNDGNSKREFIKNLLKELTYKIPRLRACVFGAIQRSNIPGWELPQKLDDKN